MSIVWEQLVPPQARCLCAEALNPSAAACSVPFPQGLGRSSEDRLRASRAKALERLEGKRQALQARALGRPSSWGRWLAGCGAPPCLPCPPLVHASTLVPNRPPPLQTQDAIHKAYSLCNLVLRNREAPEPLVQELLAAGSAAPHPLSLPFMLIKASAGGGLACCGGRRARCTSCCAPGLFAPGLFLAPRSASWRAARPTLVSLPLPLPFLVLPPPQAGPDADVVVDISDTQLHADLDFQE